MRVDKTLSELWHLRGNTDEPPTFEEFREEASNTAFLAINTIKRLQEENERYEKALNLIIKNTVSGHVENIAKRALEGK